MTDPLALLDEASWFDTIVDARPLHRVGRIRDDRAVYAVVDWTRTVGDLRRLLAIARDAERLRGALVVIAEDDDLVKASGGAWGQQAYERRRDIARATLEGTDR